jgi:hypothetical protein
MWYDKRTSIEIEQGRDSSHFTPFKSYNNVKYLNEDSKLMQESSTEEVNKYLDDDVLLENDDDQNFD